MRGLHKAEGESEGVRERGRGRGRGRGKGRRRGKREGEGGTTGVRVQERSNSTATLFRHIENG